MKKVVEIAHDLLMQANICGAAADFTLGQGYDCECLMSLRQVQRVYAFDIQPQALADAKRYLKDKPGYEKVIFLQESHAQAKRWIHEPIQAGIFNFGYYPKGDHSITTVLETSQQAVTAALELLAPHGILVLVLYPGHAQGLRECEYFDRWSAALPSRSYDCALIRMSNKRACPYIIVIEKKRL